MTKKLQLFTQMWVLIQNLSFMEPPKNMPPSIKADLSFIRGTTQKQVWSEQGLKRESTSQQTNQAHNHSNMF